MRRRSLPILSFVLVLLTSSSTFAQQSGSTTRITVNPAERFQFIEGFGVNVVGPWFRDDQKATFDKLIDDLGASMFRVGAYIVHENWEEVNMHDPSKIDVEGNRDQELAVQGVSANWEYWENRYSSPLFEASWAEMRYLNSRGIRPLVALYGSIPDWMTDDTVGPLDKAVSLDELYRNRKNHLSPKMYDAFAEEVVSMLAYARSNAHVEFSGFSPFNETTCNPTEGPGISSGEAPAVLDAVAKELNKEGLPDVKLVVADQCSAADDFFGPILSDARLMKQVGALDLHNYGDNEHVALNAGRIQKSKFPQTPLWLTEYGELNDLDRTAENDWHDFSLAVGRRGLSALNQGATVLMYWDAFDDYEDCVQRICYYGLFRSAGRVYQAKKRYFALKQLYHFVPPGSQRIAATTSATGLTVSAFRIAEANSIVLVRRRLLGNSTRQRVW